MDVEKNVLISADLLEIGEISLLGLSRVFRVTGYINIGEVNAVR